MRNRGGIEGVGFENVGAGFQIGGMNAANHLRLREQQEVVVTFEIAREISEARAAVIGLLQAVALDHGAHGAIENQNALGEEIGEQGCAVGLHGGGSESGCKKQKTRSADRRERAW